MNIGDIVIFKQGYGEWPKNGTFFHPAIVTRAWPDDTLNLFVMFDAVGLEVRIAVPKGDTEHDGSCWMPRDG